MSRLILDIFAAASYFWPISLPQYWLNNSSSSQTFNRFGHFLPALQFMRLQGKRNRGKEEVKFLEIKGDDQLSGNQQWMTKSMTEEKQNRQSFSKVTWLLHCGVLYRAPRIDNVGCKVVLRFTFRILLRFWKEEGCFVLFAHYWFTFTWDLRTPPAIRMFDLELIARESLSFFRRNNTFTVT